MIRFSSFFFLFVASNTISSATGQFGGAINDNDFVNDPVVPEEIYDIVNLTTSLEKVNSPNIHKYYCVFRGNWDIDTQPAFFPDPLARFGNPVLYSGSNELRPWIQNRPATRGVEVFVEEKFSDEFQRQVELDTELFDLVEAFGFAINNKEKHKNFVNMPEGILVDASHHWISGLAPFDPSPDWMTGFYLFDTTDEITREFFSDFTIRLYPWDLGTDEGDTYTALAIDIDQIERVQRFTKDTVPNGIFLDPTGQSIPHTAELQCQLLTCFSGTEQQCQRENWPPANKCDVLKYPGCDQQCDPTDATLECNECKPRLGETESTFYFDCCASMTEPINGNCENFGNPSGSANMSYLILFTFLVGGTLAMW